MQTADVKAHGQVVLESKDIMWNRYFADIKGADAKAHLKVAAEVEAQIIGGGKE